MRHLFTRVAAVALAGALAGLLCLWLAHTRQTGVAWEMDRDLAPLASGFYPVERDGELTFAWTAGTASFRLEGLRRDGPWACEVRLRGGRPADRPQPLVRMTIDGLVAAEVTATNSYQDVAVPVAARPGREGLLLAIAADPVMVPGPDDPRPLGVQVDRLACRPEGGGLARPPGPALFAAAVSSGAFGGATVLLGLGPLGGLTAAGALALAQGYPLSAGVGPYSTHPGTVARLALAVALLLAMAGLLARLRARPLHPAAAFAVAFAAGAALLELYALTHPAKPIVDALFQAHRLEWVLDGRYFFTQPMPDGVRFPYAIALYVVAAPWAWLTSDHVTLLRVVVVVARAISAVALYPLVRRAGGSRFTAATSTALVYVVPLPYISIGNANLTFVFGQSAAMCALAAAVAWPLERRRLAAGLGLFLLASLAFLSHVGIFPILLATLLALAALSWWAGGAHRRAAWVLLAATACAAVFSVTIYYGRFAEAYQTLERVRARAASVVAARPGEAGAPAEAAGEPSPGGPGLPQRAAHAARLGVRAMGWPLVLLAALGVARAWRDRARDGARAGASDRVVLAAVAMAAAYLVFLAAAIAAPVEPRFQRYTDEFIDRLSYATMPAVVLMAARGASWWWGGRVVLRLAVVGLLATSAALAAGQWLAWLD